MKSVYLLDGCRSPIGRGHPEKGIYRELRAEELALQTLQALFRRTDWDSARIDDFFLGCVGQHMEQGKNLARLILLLGKYPDAIPGATINRLCGSSLTALQLGADSIKAGTNESVLIGGVEHMGHVPMTASLDYHPDLFKDFEFQWTNMGLTAEKLTEQYGIDRQQQDTFALESNRRHFAARDSGFLQREIVPIRLSDGTIVDTDQEPRLSSLDDLVKLRTVFKDDGTVTAANASGVSDGACMALIGGEESLARFCKPPLARIEATATVGLDPTVMGLGPVSAVRLLLSRADLSVNDIDLFEINEAFAVQVLACQRELQIPTDKLNVHGGAVALGHPLGMSGLRLAVTLAHSMAERNARRGIASLCVGHGQGVAMLLERD